MDSRTCIILFFVFEIFNHKTSKKKKKIPPPAVREGILQTTHLTLGALHSAAWGARWQRSQSLGHPCRLGWECGKGLLQVKSEEEFASYFPSLVLSLARGVEAKPHG